MQDHNILTNNGKQKMGKSQQMRLSQEQGSKKSQVRITYYFANYCVSQYLKSKINGSKNKHKSKGLLTTVELHKRLKKEIDYELKVAFITKNPLWRHIKGQANALLWQRAI